MGWQPDKVGGLIECGRVAGVSFTSRADILLAVDGIQNHEFLDPKAVRDPIIFGRQCC